MSTRDLLQKTARRAADYLESLPDRPVAPVASPAQLREALGGPLGERGVPPEEVIEQLVRDASGGIMASAGPRFFGFVVGGSLPAALAADWLAGAWDQNAGLSVLAPAAAVVEEVAGQWIRELLGLPTGASVGFVTGCQAANFTALASARHAVLERAGWDVEGRGLYGAPEIAVVLGEEAHVTIRTALQMLGLGRDRVHKVAVDGQGRMRADALAEVLSTLGERPLIVCTQAGNVNSGAFDPLAEIIPLAHRHGAWVHVDGAFGLWAGASARFRPLVAGLEQADSWATDAHKWLNVPYDSGLVFTAHPAAHRAALTATAAYLDQTEGRDRDPFEWTPEFSRRARGFAVWAALRSLGRQGVAELVERTSDHARLFADRLRTIPGIHILNDVVLNQTVVRIEPPGGGDEAASDAFTRASLLRVQQSGEAWPSGTTWRGKAAIRISVSGWMTTTADVERSVEAIRRAALR
ncbi:MAG: aminotransferase class V-fold PLP-dependent enzyme [Acidobacteriota bacterium]